MNLKKIKWTNRASRVGDRIKGRLCFTGSFMDFTSVSFILENFKYSRKGVMILTTDTFYLYIINRGEMRKYPVNFNSLEEAKEVAQEECFKLFVQKYFESEPKRTVLIEKSKRKKYVRKKRQPTLVLASFGNRGEDEWTFFNLE